MTWFTHKTIAIAGALALEASPLGLFATLIGSILPDLTDKTLAMGNKRQWRHIHRQSSHWFGWYLSLIVIGLISFPFRSFELPPIVIQFFSEMTLWVGFGGITHVLLDGLTPMGIPMLPFGSKQRIGFNLISTGGIGERVFLFIALSFIILQYNWSKQIIYRICYHIKPIIFPH